jgi:hypothetical protein
MKTGPQAFIIIGSLLIIAGLIWHFSGAKFPLGRLPGDIHIKGENSHFYFPITSGIIVSMVLSALAYFLRK